MVFLPLRFPRGKTCRVFYFMEKNITALCLFRNDLKRRGIPTDHDHPVRRRKGPGDRGGRDAGQAGYIINRWGIHKTGSPFQCKKALTFMHNKDKAPSAVICAYDIMAKFGLQ